MNGSLHRCFLLLIYLCLQLCQPADIKAKTFFRENQTAIGSLRAIIWDTFPETVLTQEKSDFACAVALGYFLFHPKRRLANFSSEKQNIFVDVAKMNSVIENELFVIPTNVPPTLAKLRKELSTFVERTLDREKLQFKVSMLASVDGSAPISLPELHNLVGKCAKSHLAVLSIDVAILKWVDVVLRHEKMKPLVFASEEPMVSQSLCQALVSLLFLPEVYCFVKKELKKFMESLQHIQKDAYDSYAYNIARLMLPLPKGLARKRLTALIAQSSFQKFTKNNPHLADFVVDLDADNVSALCEMRSDWDFRILMGASIESTIFDCEMWRIYPVKLKWYKGSFANGQFEIGMLKKVHPRSHYAQFYSEPRFCIDIITSIRVLTSELSKPLDQYLPQKFVDVFVASHIPLNDKILTLLAKWALGDVLSEDNLRDLLYAQGAYGILMVTSPQIDIVELHYTVNSSRNSHRF